MSNISQILNKIRTAIYGYEVRDSICEAIEKTYVNAINYGNTNMEVVQARGSYDTLNDRLNSINVNTSNNDFTLELIAENVLNIDLYDKTFFECIDEVEGINFTSNNIDVNFNCIVSFRTKNINTYSPIRLSNIKFVGDNCTNEELILKSNSLYFIEFKYLKNNCLIANVICTTEGDEGNTNDEGEDDNTTTPTVFNDADEFINVAMSYFNVRNTMITYGQTTVLSYEGGKSWTEITVSGVDSTDGRYRNLDCSTLVGLALRGISFNEVLLNQATYNNKDLSARTSVYNWAKKLPRTAAEMCRATEELGWSLPKTQWHIENNDWGGLKKGDIYFLGGANNGRYKGIYHVGIYIGEYISSDGTHKICILDCSSNPSISKHSDGKTKGVRILQFSKVDRSNIVGIARIKV